MTAVMDGSSVVLLFGEERVGGKVAVGDGAVNEGNEYSTIHRTRTIFTDSRVVGEGVGRDIDVRFYFGFLYA